MSHVNKLRFVFPTWGVFLGIMAAITGTWVVQSAAYESSQAWTTTWEGTCVGTWEEQPKEDPEDKEEEVVSALMIACGEHEKFKATKDFTIDYYRAQVQTVNCVQTLGSYSNRFKWDCQIGEIT